MTGTDPTKQWSDAAWEGDAQAQYILGEAYSKGFLVHQDFRQALQWYRRAAEQGHLDAQEALARMYEEGMGTARDLAEAARWYRRAAEDHPVEGGDARLALAGMYEFGRGVPRDYVEAYRWRILSPCLDPYNSDAAEYYEQELRKLVAKMSPAQVAEGRRLASEWSRQKYEAELLVTAREGKPESLRAVGDGFADQKRYEEAVKWYRLAADKGSLDAKCRLARIYLSGVGVQQDLAEGVRLYREAAREGLREAQDQLGLMYFHGTHVEQDKAEAARLFTLAAEQGYLRVMDILATMYMNGDGIPQNLVQAFKWFNILVGWRHGVSKTPEERRQEEDLRVIATKLTDAEIAEARQLCEEHWAERDKSRKSKTTPDL